MILLASLLVVGLFAAGLTATIRTVVGDRWPEMLLLKPLSCDLCMSFWGSFAGTVLASTAIDSRGVSAPLQLFGGVSVALLATKAAARLST